MKIFGPEFIPMKIHIHTFGCQMNERDSESVAALLKQSGMELAEDESDADVVIVNTCSVRGKAEEKAIGKLRLLSLEKKRCPKMKIGAMGCMVQRMKEHIFEVLPELDFAVGTRAIIHMPEVILQVLNGSGKIFSINNGIPDDLEQLTGHVGSHPTAFVNILIGCNMRCSFCIVPKVRGAEWSRPAHSILEEISQLVQSGVREVTLLGQSVMSYGRSNSVWDMNYVSSRGYRNPFVRLLEAVNDINGIERVRFASGHPSGCTIEVASAMQELSKVCEHIHLPLQSGADRILRLMRRGYSVSGFCRAVDRIRKKVPNLAITTDIIVGFPTETEKDFEMTRKLMDEINFDSAFIFKYSERPGTEAARLKDDVPFAEKEQRNKVLLEEQARRSERINRQLIGKKVEVLVEGPSTHNSERWSGRTRTNKIVILELSDSRPGDVVDVYITHCTSTTLYGSISSSSPQ